MMFKKMTFDGITYNVLTDEELAQVEHLGYLRSESERIHSDIESNTVTSEEFEKRFKERYGI